MIQAKQQSNVSIGQKVIKGLVNNNIFAQDNFSKLAKQKERENSLKL